jgi:hypothetical protein
MVDAAVDPSCFGLEITTGCSVQQHHVILHVISQFDVTGESLDEVMLSRLNQTRVALLKLDILGFEPHVIAGAAQVLEKHLVDNILLEYSPYTAEHARSA